MLIDTLTVTMNGNTPDMNGLRCYNVTIASRELSSGQAYYYGKNHLFALLSTAVAFRLLSLHMLNDIGAVGHN